MRDQQSATLQTEEQEIARRISKERHGTESLWQAYIHEASREVTQALVSHSEGEEQCGG